MKSESIKQDTCTYVLTVSGKQPLFSVGHWQNVCKKLAGILIFFYLEENRSNKSDELAKRFTTFGEFRDAIKDRPCQFDAITK